MSRVKQITLGGVVADPNGLFVEASFTGEATLLTTTLDPPRQIQLDSGGTDNSGDTATLVGTDRYGRPITETMLAPGITSLTLSTKTYATITSISLGSAVVDLQGGWGNTTLSQWFPINNRVPQFAITAEVIVVPVGATLTYSVERTYEDLQRDPATGILRTEEVVADDLHDDATLGASQSARGQSFWNDATGLITGARLKIITWTDGSLILRLNQARH